MPTGSAPAPSLPARTFGYIILTIFLGAGPLLLLLTLVTGVQKALFIHSSHAADGVVIGFQEIHPSTNTSYAPVYRFTASDGEVHTVTSRIAQRPSPFRTNQHVRVIYDPRHPEDAHIDSFAQLWEPQLVMGIVGSAFSTLPAIIFIRRRRLSKLALLD